MIFALAIVAGALLSSWLGWLSDSLSNVMMTTAGVIVFISLREFVRGVNFAELSIGSALSVDVVACLAQAGGMLLLLHFGALTASRTLTLLGISSAVAAGGWLALHRRAFQPDTRLYVRDLERNWIFAKWVLGSGILSVFARYLYPWMLAAFHGTSVTGSWAACASIVALGNPVVLGLGNYVLPKISNVYATSGTAVMQRGVHRSSLLFALLLLPVVVILAVCGERIVTGSLWQRICRDCRYSVPSCVEHADQLSDESLLTRTIHSGLRESRYIGKRRLGHTAIHDRNRRGEFVRGSRGRCSLVREQQHNCSHPNRSI